MITIDFHPLCEMFPEMPDEDYQKLRDDIAGSGQLEPIVLFGGKILDGRHRYRACIEIGIEPWVKEYDGPDSPVDYVISVNLRRRHLTESQRAQIFAALCKWQPGSNQHGGITTEGEVVSRDTTQFTRTQGAALANVSEPTMARAMAVDRNGDESLKRTVVDGSITVKEAAAVVKILPSKSQQAEAVQIAKNEGKKVVVIAQQLAAKPKMRGEYATLDQWAAMSEQDREQFLSQRDTQIKFNKQDNDSIEWADWSWNPVTGCKHDCPYCYARDIAERFYEQKFEPSFWPGRLDAPENTKPSKGPAGNNVFSNSMSDLYGRWVPKQWIDMVLQTMRDNQQWNFLMLTKFPKRAAEFKYSPNCWIGTSVDLQARVKSAEDAFEKIDCGVKWLSIEPMIEPIKFSRPELFNWVVIGGASKSNQTPEWVPPFEWIVRVASQFLEHGAKIYLKENGRPKDFPGIITPDTAGDVFHYLKHDRAA